MSNRLTFSLASLIVIFALAFVVTPVMAQNSPTVTIMKHLGHDTLGDTSTDARTVQERDDFRVLLTFSHPVEALAVDDVQFRLMNLVTGLWSTAANVSAAPTAIDAAGATTTTGDLTRFVVTIDGGTVSTATTNTRVEIIVEDDVTDGTRSPNNLGNVGARAEFALPTVLGDNAEVSFGMPEAVTGQVGRYTVGVTFTNTTPEATGSTDNNANNAAPISAGTNDLVEAFVNVVGNADVSVALGAHTTVTGGDDPDKAGTSTYTLTVTLREDPSSVGFTSVTLSINPGYAMAAETGGSVMVPTPIDPPAAPTFTATKGVEKVTLMVSTPSTPATIEYRQRAGTGAWSAWMDYGTSATKEITGLTAGTAYSFEARVKANPPAPAGMVTSQSATPDPQPGPDPIAGEITIPAMGYVVVVRDDTDMANHLSDSTLPVGAFNVVPDSINIQVWSDMPDLATLFRRSAPGKGGGAIAIVKSTGHTGNIGVGTVGISEIMWAWDEGSVFGQTLNQDHTREQWIELHNLNSTEVKVMLKAYNATDHTVMALNPQAGEIDRASNFNVNNVWDVKGQSGNSALGKDFVSMRRSKNGNPYNHGDNNGRNGGKWHASEFVYLRKVAELQNSPLLEKLVYDFKGTPGRSNTISPTGAPSRSNLPNSPVIFNEIANLRDQTLEWIELKNVSNNAVDLRRWEIGIVTRDANGNREDRFFYFDYGDNHVVMQPGSVLLLVDTDPRYNDDHPVAVGYNVRGGNDQALGLGDNAPRYLVTNFAEGGLPDNGEFVLILRTSKPDENYENNKGKPNRASDAIGYHPGLNSTGHPKYTRLWPFNVFGTPKARNKIELETVHYRRHAGQDPDQGDNNKPEQIALNNAWYTGVGYKRFANRHNPAHFGTPGYDHHGLVQNELPGIGGGGVVTISEIMLDQGDGRYPQWIELYNSSDKPVNLHAGDHGWRLHIENYDDGEIPINRLSGTLNFRSSDVQTILPKQTVLVASTRARSSGSAFFDTNVIFPPTRVFSVWDDARGALDMKRTTDPILSTRGFYIELVDGKNRVSDSVGNLIDSPNRRVAAEIAWELTEITGEMMDDEMMMDDAPRSSILRRYREPKGGDSRDWVPYTSAQLMDMGIVAEGWVLASMTDFRDVRQTWYGHGTDVGSPGITGGRVLPVELSTFRPVRLDDGSVAIRWITESEKDNAGFNILRSEDRTGEFTKINTQLIAGQGTTSERTPYEFVDKSAKPNVIYYYQIQDVSLDGDIQTLAVTHLRGHVSPSGKATTTWGELKALQ